MEVAAGKEGRHRFLMPQTPIMLSAEVAEGEAVSAAAVLMEERVFPLLAEAAEAAEGLEIMAAEEAEALR